MPASMIQYGPNLSPKANQYILDMKDGLDAEDHTVIKRLHERKMK
jgi:hypothetical protein